MEDDIRLPKSEPATSPRRERESLSELLKRRWLPIYSLGCGVIATLIDASIYFGGGGRSIADAYDRFAQLDSVHVVRHYRFGPGQQVIRDDSQPVNASPNFRTSVHPLNPLVQDKIWFRQNETGVPQVVTRNDRETIWQEENRQLKIIKATGERIFRLNSNPLNIQEFADPISPVKRSSFRQVDPDVREMLNDPALDKCWLGETELRGPSINGWTRPKWIQRVWFDENEQLVRRIELLSTDYAEVQGPWVQNAFEFSEFDAEFDDSIFEHEVTEADAEQIGLTLEELKSLSTKAVSIELTGELGVAFSGTIRDSIRTTDLKGTLPHIFVVDPVGAAFIDIRLSDEQKHSFGVSANGMGMQTFTSRIVAEVSVNGSFSARSAD